MAEKERSRAAVAAKPGAAKDVDAYIAGQQETARPMLEAMRAIIRSAAPTAEEVISYGVPVYKNNGMVVGFGAAKRHVGLYAMSPAVLECLEKPLAAYDTSKGTVRFPLGRPLDEDLIREIVALRLAENEAKRRT